MTELICLDPNYSTTRCLTRDASISPAPSHLIFEKILYWPLTQLDKAGGLRTNQYFKVSGSATFAAEPCVEKTVKPLITVITAVFNGGATLEKTIRSVLNQSYSNIEFIIIDGGSTDDTLDIIKRYEHAIDYWVSGPDAGIYDAWNKGVRLASGDWIAFLGADDAYTEGAIEAYASRITASSHSQPEYISSRVNMVNHSTILRVVGAPWTWRVFRKYMNVAHVGSLHHRTLFEKHGLFNASYKISGDYEFLLRTGSTLRAHFLDFITVDMLVGGVSDANILVFNETTRAKITTGGRGILICQFEKYYAILKWKLRSYLRN